MARGDLVVFEEAMAKMLDGDWASTDHFYCAICDNTVAPTAATATPTLGDFPNPSPLKHTYQKSQLP